MATATRDTQYNGVITRRLSAYAFETHNPTLCADWLRALEYVDVPRHGPREYARLMIGSNTTIVVYRSGLVLCLPGEPGR